MSETKKPDRQDPRQQLDSLLIDLKELPSITEERLTELGPFLSQFIRPVDVKSIDFGDLEHRESTGVDAYLCSTGGTLKEQDMCFFWCCDNRVHTDYVGSEIIERHRRLVPDEVLGRPAERWIARLDLHALSDYFVCFYGEPDGGIQGQELAALKQEIETDLRMVDFPECQADSIVRNRLVAITRFCWLRYKHTEFQIIGPQLVEDALSE